MTYHFATISWNLARYESYTAGFGRLACLVLEGNLSNIHAGKPSLASFWYRLFHLQKINVDPFFHSHQVSLPIYLGYRFQSSHLLTKCVMLLEFQFFFSSKSPYNLLFSFPTDLLRPTFHNITNPLCLPELHAPIRPVCRYQIISEFNKKLATKSMQEKLSNYF